MESCVLVAVILHNLGQSYNGFVSSTIQNLWNKKHNMDIVFACILDQKHCRDLTKTSMAFHSMKETKQAIDETYTHSKRADYVHAD